MSERTDSIHTYSQEEFLGFYELILKPTSVVLGALQNHPLLPHPKKKNRLTDKSRIKIRIDFIRGSYQVTFNAYINCYLYSNDCLCYR